MTLGYQRALEDLYRTFQSYSLRAYTEPCPCCHKDPTVEHRLHASPLRALSAEDLNVYAQDAVLTWGTEEDFKYFLPRLFELQVEAELGGLPFSDPESLFGRLAYTHWNAWPSQEQAAIREFFLQLWTTVVNTVPADLLWSAAYEWLRAIAQAEDDVSAYLSLWLGQTTDAACRNLALAITLHDLLAEKPSEAYWQKRRKQWAQIAEWVRTLGVREKLGGAFDRVRGDAARAEIYAALAMLR